MAAGMVRLAVGVCAALLLCASLYRARAEDPDVARGKYLVALGGCSDCHTPGGLTGRPDMAHYLGGSDVGFAIPGQGVFVAPNLTPDEATGLGKWTEQQIITAFTTGRRPDGRQLVPIMPWPALSQLTPSDAKAIVGYLKSLKPVQHAVPGPFGPDETPSVLVMAVLPGEVYAGLPLPKAK